MVSSIILLARWSLSKSNVVALFYLQDLFRKDRDSHHEDSL